MERYNRRTSIGLSTFCAVLVALPDDAILCRVQRLKQLQQC